MKKIVEVVRESQIRVIWWVIIVLVAVLLCFSNIYNDILIVGKGSHDLWDYIFQGRILDFYTRTPVVPGNYYTVEQKGVYPFVAQFILAVWVFPIWLLGKILRVNIFNTIGSMIWIKLFLFMCYIKSGSKLYDVLKKITDNKYESATGVFLLLSSGIIYINTFVASQIEILTVLLSLCFIEAWIDKDDVRFIIFATLAVGIKYFAILAIIPMLIIRTKKSKKLIVYAIIILSPVIETFLHLGGGNAGAMQGRFTGAVFSLGPSGISFFIMISLLVVCYSFFVDANDLKEEIYHVLLCEIVEWGAFCLTVNINPYWGVLLVPYFTVAVIVLMRNNIWVIWIETVLFCTIIFTHLNRFFYVYDIRTVLEMGVIPRIFESVIDYSKIDFTYSPINFLETIGMSSESMVTISYNVSLVAWLVLVWLCLKHLKMCLDTTNHISENLCKHLILRAFLNVSIGAMPTMLCVAYLLFMN